MNRGAFPLSISPVFIWLPRSLLRSRLRLRAGLEVGRDQVARLMKRQGIRGASRAKKRFTTHADANNLRAPDLVNREFTAACPDQLWVPISPTAPPGVVLSTSPASSTFSVAGPSAGKPHGR